MPDSVAKMLVVVAAVAGCALAGVALAGCAPDAPPAAPPPPPPPPMTAAPPPAPTASAAPAPTRKQRVRVTEFKVDSNGLQLPGPVVFEPGSDRLSPVSDEALEVVHDFLDAKPEITLLRIEGHMDSEGKPEDSQILSEKRAMTVARWLVAVGVRCERLIVVGFGQTKPLTSADTPDSKAQNRRIAFVPAALNHHPIGGNPVDAGHKPAGDPCR